MALSQLAKTAEETCWLLSMMDLDNPVTMEIGQTTR